MTCRYKLWIIAFWSLLTFFVVIMQGANSAAEFYAKHPRLQQFFPFEVYGEIYCSPKQREGGDDSWELRHSDLTTVQLILGRLGIGAFDFLADNILHKLPALSIRRISCPLILRRTT